MTGAVLNPINLMRSYLRLLKMDDSPPQLIAIILVAVISLMSIQSHLSVLPWTRDFVQNLKKPSFSHFSRMHSFTISLQGANLFLTSSLIVAPRRLDNVI